MCFPKGVAGKALIYLHSQLDEEQLCSGQEDGLTGLPVLSVFPPLE